MNQKKWRRRGLKRQMLNIENDQRQIELDIKDFELIEKVVLESLQDFKEIFGVDGEINIFLIDDDEMRRINYEHRGIDKTTDVLSFPLIHMDVSGDLLTELDLNPETNCALLGDILISVEQCARQAKELGHSFSRELGFLVVHGVLHLMGYDHQEQEDEVKMLDKQEDILNSLGIKRTGN